MGSRDVGKSMNKLTTFIDSVQQERDSIHRQTIVSFKNNIYGRNFSSPRSSGSPPDSLLAGGFFAYFDRLPVDKKIKYLQSAKWRTEQQRMDYEFTNLRQTDSERQLLSHQVQFYKRFSMALILSFS